MTKRNAKRDAIRRKAVGRAPGYLKTVMISKMPKKQRIKGSFGAASEVVRIDPKTGGEYSPREPTANGDTMTLPVITHPVNKAYLRLQTDAWILQHFLDLHTIIPLEPPTQYVLDNTSRFSFINQIPALHDMLPEDYVGTPM